MVGKKNQHEVLPEDEDQIGVESEAEEEGLAIDRPFDPEKIKVRTEPAIIGQLIRRISHNEIDLAPDFQRLAGIWNSTRKSRLIESLLLRIPLPVFYVAADERERWAVVDGLQRMTTINDFVHDRFDLSGLEYLTQFNGLVCSELPRPMQRRIDETALIVNVIDPGTPEEVMFNIFSRINTGGLRLNGQEIRHALNKNPSRAFLKDLASSKEFITATDGSVKPDRMADRECALRFLAFKLHSWREYSDSTLDTFLGQTMKAINKMRPHELVRLKEEFLRSMRVAREIFRDDAFRKRFHEGAGRNVVSKALFEAWSVQLSERSDSELALLIDRRNALRKTFIEVMNNDAQFNAAISYSTGNRRRVEKRFSTVGKIIDSVLQ
ncbi:MAG: DUF262 domain-containing protein [Candidatus Afipia apatlaquensis]|uniref:DUF262 domain-containing protein n=1 Tax=Candidatus Afipia apatlaquensis TaxID=2712852 RepID=A0A7C9VS38_9BRAD|nr:DUF262 domain-containing protein [Candidatus Afipia apatlaquensis]